MARIAAWLVFGALVLTAMPTRAEEQAATAAAEPAPAAECDHHACHACRHGHDGIRHVLQWLTYRSSDRPGCCCHYAGNCIPPLYTFFLCEGTAPYHPPCAEAVVAEESPPCCAKHRLHHRPRKCGCAH